jgi:iron(III) transport system permease protein
MSLITNLPRNVARLLPSEFELLAAKKRRRPRGVAMLITSLLCGVAIFGFVVVIVWIGFKENTGGVIAPGYTLKYYRDLFSEAYVYRALLNTVGFAAISLAVAFAVAMPLAWIVERSDLPGRQLIYFLMIIGVLVPGLFTAMGWMFLLHPQIGILNVALRNLFGFDHGPVNIVSVAGMGLVQGLGMASIAFIILAPSYRALHPALEEAARVHGMSLYHTLRRVSIPLVFPATLAAAIYIVTISIAAFEVPAVIGLSDRIFTFSTLVYFEANPQDGFPDYGPISALSSLMILAALLLSWCYIRVLKQSYKYASVTGQAYAPRIVKIKKRKFVIWSAVGLFFLMSKVLPLLLLVWAAIVPWLQVPSISALSKISLISFWKVDWSLVWAGFKNTALLIAIVPTVTTLLSIVISWVLVRSKFPGKVLIDFLTFLPHAMPNIIFAVSSVIVALFILPNWIPLYGTINILIVVYCMVWIAFGTRALSSAMTQIHKELDEAGVVSGMSVYTVLTRILLPLLKPALFNAWLWIALLVGREFTIASILATTRENMTMPVVTWSYWHGGQMGEASAVALVTLVFMVPLVALYWRISRRKLEFVKD